MYILEVIPFAKTMRKEHLSYFSSKKVGVGDIVTIELRNKNVKGLVINIEEAKDLKEKLKSSSFRMKKIKSVSENTLFNKPFIKSANRCAEYFATGTGAVIQTVIPNKLLDNFNKIKKTENKKNHEPKETPERYIIQDQDDRFSHYKSLIREEFAKKHSVIFICPTIEDVINTKENLKKGIEDHTFIFHSNLSPKEILEKWNKVIEYKKPALVIMTGGFLAIPRDDIGSIILDKESSKVYKSKRRPYIDIRNFAEYYAEEMGARFFLGDIMLRSETLWRYDNGHFFDFGALKFRSLSSAEKILIDMKKNKNNAGDVFSILSNEALRMIKNTKETNERIFLLVNRKGLSPNIICGDCGTIVTCNKCSAPVVLHGKDVSSNENYFRCHVCGEERYAGERCKVCDSWRLKTYGIGSETVLEEVREKFPEIKSFILDSQVAKTPQKARKIAEEFYDSPGSLLVGTEMALMYLHQQIENVVIVSIDSLFSLPDFSIRERVLNILTRARSKAQNNFIIQTRKAEDKIFEYSLRGNLADFYREEFVFRKQFAYPPFSILIKISTSGQKAKVIKEFEKLKEFFKPYDLLIYPAFTEIVKGKFVMNGIIKIDRKTWIDKDLCQKIKDIGPQYKVIIDTDSLL